jgi:putative ABC transport system substrate-binding protein
MKRNEKPLVGILMSIAESDREVSSRREAILQGLGRTNMQITLRFGRKKPESNLCDYELVAKELVALKPDALFSSCYPTMVALATETAKAAEAGGELIPIVYAGLFNKDGQEGGYSFAENVTGFVSHEFDVCKKWKSLLHEIAPRLTQAAVIYESASTGGTNQYNAVDPAGACAQIDLTQTSSPILLEDAIAKFKNKAATGGGLIVTTGALTATLGETIIRLAAKYKLPAIYPNRLYTVCGGLVSYGADLLDLYRGAGGYLGKILDGARPCDLATQVNKYFEVVINLNTAASLGLEVSRGLRDRASLLVGD